MTFKFSPVPSLSNKSRVGLISRLPSKVVHIIVVGGLLITAFAYIGTRDAFAKDVNVINLPSSNLGMPENRLSYTMGVGDLDGDGDYDYLARVWIDDDIDKDFKTITYAVRNDGTILWEFHHNMTYRDTSGDPTWIVTLSVWDMDGDGADEVMTQMKDGGTTKLVMLDGETGTILKSISIPSPKRILHATIAYLDGVNPYLVIAQGRDMVTTAYDKDLQVYWSLNDSDYYGHFSWTNIYTADVDSDGRDEIVNGALIIDDDGSVYLDGAQWDHPNEGEAERSLVGDIDPDNPGLEWYLQRAGTNNDPYRVQPNYWEGPYLIDLDQKEILWHHNLDVNDRGWGRMHRGWVYDVDPSPGLEMFATGYFWKVNEWQNALDGVYGAPPGPDDVWVEGYSETWFLYAADGTILRTQVGKHVGYPLFWDDDDTAEYYRYRQGILLNKFKGSTLESGFAQANGSGESIQVDILGDWREEIIVASGYKLYIYSNNSSTAYPNRPSPREDHTYLMNMASYGTGLPKPLLTGGGEWLIPPTITPAPTNTPTASPLSPTFTPLPATGTPIFTYTPLPPTFTPIAPSDTPTPELTSQPANITYEGTQFGGSSSSILVSTSGYLTTVDHQLYLAAISAKSGSGHVTSVFGLGLSWSLLRAQCAGRGQTRTEVWMAQGYPSFDGPVTATLSEAPSSAIIAVSRYSGVDPANPIGNIISANTNGIDGSCSGGSDQTAYSFDLRISTDGAVAFASIAHRHKAHVPGTGFTERIEVHQGSSGSAAGLSLVDQTVDTAIVNVGGSFSGTVDWAVVAVEVLPITGPAPAHTPTATSSPTHTPSPTSTATRTSTPTPTNTPTSSATMTHTPLPPNSTLTPPTETPSPTPTYQPGGALLVDAVSSGTTATSGIAIPHTTSGSDRLMLVAVSINNDNFEIVTSINYGGVPLTFVGSKSQSDDARIEIWKLVDPPLGTHNVLIYFSADLKRYAVAGVITFTGADQVDPLGTFVGNNATTNSASVTVPSEAGELVLGLFSCETCDSVIFSASGVERWNLAVGGGNEIGAGATYDGAAAHVNISVSLGARDHWALGGISIRPASSVSPTPTNMQTPSPTGSPTPVPTDTPTPTNTPTSSATMTHTPTPTIMPTSTPKSSPPTQPGEIVYEGTQWGGSAYSASVTTSGNLTALSNHLYLAAISTKSGKGHIINVSGLGLSWSLVKAQCAGRSQTRTEIWMALGNPSFDGPVTATLSEAPSNAIITVSRYSGVDPANPIGNIVSANTNGIAGPCSGGSDEVSYSFNLPVYSNGAVAFAAIAHRHKAHTPGAGFTERLEVHQGSSGSAAGLSIIEQSVNPILVPIEGSFSGTVDWAIVAIEIRPAP